MLDPVWKEFQCWIGTLEETHNMRKLNFILKIHSVVLTSYFWLLNCLLGLASTGLCLFLYLITTTLFIMIRFVSLYISWFEIQVLFGLSSDANTNLVAKDLLTLSPEEDREPNGTTIASSFYKLRMTVSFISAYYIYYASQAW